MFNPTVDILELTEKGYTDDYIIHFLEAVWEMKSDAAITFIWATRLCS